MKKNEFDIVFLAAIAYCLILKKYIPWITKTKFWM